MKHTRFTPRMDDRRQQRLWLLWRSGWSTPRVAAELGFHRRTVYNRIAEAGGIGPRSGRTGARLSFEDRVYIEIGLKQGRSMRAIAADLGRAPSTISREVSRYRPGSGRYSAKRAHAVAFEAARRPQTRKIDANPVLRARVVALLTGRTRCSPEQVAGRLARDFPHDRAMNVHHETIYRWIYLQPRGELKRQVTTALRSGRAIRRPHAHAAASADGRGQLTDMVSIHQRPPVDLPDGTRIPGHWESQWSCQAVIGTLAAMGST